MLFVVKRFKCSMRSKPSFIACFKSLVVTSFCKSIKDFDHRDFFELLVSHISFILNPLGPEISKSNFKSLLPSTKFNFLFTSSIVFSKLKFPLTDPNVIVF